MPTAKKKAKPKAKRPVRTAGGLSIRGYAEHRRKLNLPGGNDNSVRKALENGRISRNRYGRIDPKQADVDWIANTDPARAPASNGIPYAQARARREAAEAALKELELHERQGRLLAADDVRRKTFALFRIVRERVLAVPSRIVLPKDQELALLAELRLALEEAASVDAADVELELEKLE